jgi:glycosyltransferase involved in cell wall biosynthesis
MRVLVLHNIISPHVLPYFEGLAAEPDVDLTVWFLDRSTSARNWDTTVRGQFRWEILPGFRLEIPLEERVVLHINPSILWRIPKGKFDVVVLFAGYDSPTLWLAALICRMLRIPLVVRSGSLPGASAFGATSSRLARLRRSATRFLVRAVVRSAQTWVAYGSRSKRYLIELGASADRVYTCWNTVRTQELANQAADMRTRRDAIREERGVSQENVVFLYVGRLEAFKRVEILIDAFKCLRARMPQIILWIVGYGPKEAELKARSAAEPGIRFWGAVRMERIAEFYAAADAFVLPSGDIWGLVINEAMACGLPIVAADTVGCTDDLIMPGANGYVYRWNNVRELAEIMERLATDESLRIRLGLCSQSHIRSFSYADAVAGLASAVRQAGAIAREIGRVDRVSDPSSLA